MPRRLEKLHREVTYDYKGVVIWQPEIELVSWYYKTSDMLVARRGRDGEPPKEDCLHREDGPALEFSDGEKVWYFNGKLHREDGPAIEYANGDKEWYLNGKLHREDGPAIENANSAKFWYLNGQKVSEKELKQRVSDTYNGKMVVIDGEKY